MNPVFFLHDPDDVPKFIQEYESLLADYQRFYSNHNIYSDIAAPVEQAKTMANYVVVGTIGATILIVGLSVLLFLRDRRHELGILLSLGETKERIVRQIVADVVIFAIIAIILSLGTGQLIANQLSESMIRDELASEVNYEKDDAFWQNRLAMGSYVKHMSSEEVVDSYQIRFSLNYIITFIVVGLVTTLLATVLPTVYLINLKPKQILM